MDALEGFIDFTCAELRIALREFELAERSNKDGRLIAKLGRKVTLITNVLEDVCPNGRNCKAA